MNANTADLASSAVGDCQGIKAALCTCLSDSRLHCRRTTPELSNYNRRNQKKKEMAVTQQRGKGVSSKLREASVILGDVVKSEDVFVIPCPINLEFFCIPFQLFGDEALDGHRLATFQSSAEHNGPVWAPTDHLTPIELDVSNSDGHSRVPIADRLRNTHLTSGA